MRVIAVIVTMMIAGTLIPFPASGSPTEVPIEVWADRPEVGDVEMSRDGQRIAMLRRTSRGGDYQVMLFDTSDPEGSFKTLDTGNDAEPIDLFWANNETLIISFLLERKRDKELIQLRRYLAFNVVDDSSVNLLDAGRIDKRASAAVRAAKALAIGGIASRLRSDDNHIIIWVNEGTSINYYRVDVRTGTRELVLKGNSDIDDIEFDWTGAARTASSYDARGPSILLMARATGANEWKEVARRDARDRNRIRLLGFPELEAPDRLYFVADNEGQNYSSIYSMDVAKPSEWTLEFAIEGRDALGILVSPRIGDRGKIVGFLYAGDFRLEQYYVDPEIGALYDSIAQSFSSDLIEIVQVSDDSNTVLFKKSGPTDRGSYFMAKDGKAAKLFSVSSDLPDHALSDQKEMFTQARDGYRIPTLVTIPADRDGPLPGIVMPHGGPWVRDYYGFDAWAQMLANAGYVVVQPNYRGSEGHGLEHWRAGDSQWGLLMQDDIDDSIMDLVKQGIVAPDKVAIFGWSYGGYAAFAGATRAGAPYKCAVAGAGISDIGIMRGRVGESRFLRKYQEPTVNGFSPISRVDAVKIPMLIVHGEDDSTVPVEQSRRFYNALKDQQGADVKYIEIEDMFHSPWRHEHNMAWYPDLMTFLGSKCGF